MLLVLQETTAMVPAWTPGLEIDTVIRSVLLLLSGHIDHHQVNARDLF